MQTTMHSFLTMHLGYQQRMKIQLARAQSVGGWGGGKRFKGRQFKVRRMLSFFILLHLPVDLITKYNTFLFCPPGQMGNREKCSDMMLTEPESLT